MEVFISALPSLCIDVKDDKNERQNRLTGLELILNPKSMQLQIFLPYFTHLFPLQKNQGQELLLSEKTFY